MKMRIGISSPGLLDGSAQSTKRRATGFLGIVCGLLVVGQASLVLAEPPLPTVPVGYEARVVTAGGHFAGKHMAGITVEPVSGNIYVATDMGGQDRLETSFDLWRITPSGEVSPVGTYDSAGYLTVDLTWGPDGKIYIVDFLGDVYAIDPATGTASLFSSTQAPNLVRYALGFDAAGSLILMLPAAPNEFYRVQPGSGVEFLGRYALGVGDFDHGDHFGIQPDGDYVIYPDGGRSVFSLDVLLAKLQTAGHIPGTDFPKVRLTTTDFGSLGVSEGDSIGDVDPVTGDVYATTANAGAGSAVITVTPGDNDPN